MLSRKNNYTCIHTLCVVAKYRLDCKSAVLSANNVAFHFFVNHVMLYCCVV